MPKTQSVQFSLDTQGVAKLNLDKKDLINQFTVSNQTSSEVLLSKGFHAIEVYYVNGLMQNRRLDLRWALEEGGGTIASKYLYLQEPSQSSFILDQKLAFVSRVFLPICFLLFVFLFSFFILERVKIGILFREERFLLFCFVIFFLTQCFTTVFKLAQEVDFNILSRGDDWLSYEEFSRRILLGDWLDRLEAPFYSTPFYRYILAFSHFVFGEGIFMALMAQYFL
ncbi:MAG: hypothetical protein HYY62_00900, partial [Deltaproteobacteria bacterium]|nr:hypothetical protein [Deltaproteobacteria bacterium]